LPFGLAATFNATDRDRQEPKTRAPTDVSRDSPELLDRKNRSSQADRVADKWPSAGTGVV
jgi:hypothetical protein